MNDRGHRPSGGASSGGGGGGGGTPGKRTLTETIHRKGSGPATVSPDAAFGAATSSGGGEVPFRGEMERAFGQDFGGVSAHVGRGELGLIGAEAAARGDSVAFASSAPGREVVAHELTHVVQQRQAGGGGVAGKGGLSDPSDAAEGEADSVASRVVAGERVSVTAAPADGLHRVKSSDLGKREGEWIDPNFQERLRLHFESLKLEKKTFEDWVEELSIPEATRLLDHLKEELKEEEPFYEDYDDVVIVKEDVPNVVPQFMSMLQKVDGEPKIEKPPPKVYDSAFLTQLGEVYPHAARIIDKSQAVMKRIRRLDELGFKFVLDLETKWAYMLEEGRSINLAPHRSPHQVVSDILFEIHNALQVEDLGKIHASREVGEKTREGAMKFAFDKMRLEVTSMIETGKLWGEVREEKGEGAFIRGQETYEEEAKAAQQGANLEEMTLKFLALENGHYKGLTNNDVYMNQYYDKPDEVLACDPELYKKWIETGHAKL